MPEELKPPIRLKIKVGDMEFEIECREDQLEEAVKKILSTVKEYAREPIVAPERETCKGLIQKLWSEGWFASPRGLGEVHGEMARKGYHYDRTAVAHALIDLVKDGILTREGRPRRYQYAQKRPPPHETKK